MEDPLLIPFKMIELDWINYAGAFWVSAQSLIAVAVGLGLVVWGVEYLIDLYKDMVDPPEDAASRGRAYKRHWEEKYGKRYWNKKGYWDELDALDLVDVEEVD